jgi:hypothetical protein
MWVFWVLGCMTKGAIVNWIQRDSTAAINPISWDFGAFEGFCQVISKKINSKKCGYDLGWE